MLSTLNSDLFTILLSHRPESFKSLTKYDFDLMLSGHAHGGQIRVPFIRWLFSPNQGFSLNIQRANTLLKTIPLLLAVALVIPFSLLESLIDLKL